jgi:hypothetical protein
MSLFNRIREAVADNRVMISVHADEQLRERSIMVWQVIAGVSAGTMVRERPKDRPNPVVEVGQSLADGTPVNAVWAWVAADQAAKLVTVHFFDG